MSSASIQQIQAYYSSRRSRKQDRVKVSGTSNAVVLSGKNRGAGEAS